MTRGSLGKGDPPIPSPCPHCLCTPLHCSLAWHLTIHSSPPCTYPIQTFSTRFPIPTEQGMVHYLYPVIRMVPLVVMG